MSNPIIRLEALKQFVRNLILPLSEDVSGLKDSVPSSTDKQNWDSAKNHADSTHARTDATKVEKSTNGKIKINDSDVVVYTHPTTAGNKHIPSGGSTGQILRWSAAGTAVWGDDKDTTYANMSAATTSAAGKAGLAPAPPAGAQGKYLRGDGTWQIPTNTTYSNFVKSGSGAKAGLVPAPSTTAGSTKYLREDGTWSIPPDTNTTYTNESLGQGYGTCSTAAATAAKVVSLSGYALVVGGYVSVKFTYDVPANATLNINSKGAKAVYYKGAAIKAGTIKAGDIATFIYVNSQYHLVNIDKQIDTRLSVENEKVYLEYEQ